MSNFNLTLSRNSNANTDQQTWSQAELHGAQKHLLPIIKTGQLYQKSHSVSKKPDPYDFLPRLYQKQAGDT